MGFDIGYYDPETEDLTDPQRICNVEGFFALAEMMTLIFRLLDENEIPWHLNNPKAIQPYEVFRAYIARDREANEAKFAGYCEFARGAFAEAKKMAGEGGAVLGSNLSLHPQPEEFAPDARAFLGRSLLGGQPIDAEAAAELLQPLIWLLILFGSFETHFKDDQPDLSKHIHGLGEEIIVMGRFLESAMNENRTVFISC